MTTKRINQYKGAFADLSEKYVNAEDMNVAVEMLRDSNDGIEPTSVTLKQSDVVVGIAPKPLPLLSAEARTWDGYPVTTVKVMPSELKEVERGDTVYFEIIPDGKHAFTEWQVVIDGTPEQNTDEYPLRYKVSDDADIQHIEIVAIMRDYAIAKPVENLACQINETNDELTMRWTLMDDANRTRIYIAVDNRMLSLPPDATEYVYTSNRPFTKDFIVKVTTTGDSTVIPSTVEETVKIYRKCLIVLNAKAAFNEDNTELSATWELQTDANRKKIVLEYWKVQPITDEDPKTPTVVELGDSATTWNLPFEAPIATTEEYEITLTVHGENDDDVTPSDPVVVNATTTPQPTNITLIMTREADKQKIIGAKVPTENSLYVSTDTSVSNVTAALLKDVATKPMSSDATDNQTDYPDKAAEIAAFVAAVAVETNVIWEQDAQSVKSALGYAKEIVTWQ